MFLNIHTKASKTDVGYFFVLVKNYVYLNPSFTDYKQDIHNQIS